MTEPVRDGLDLALRGQRRDWRNAKLEAEAENWGRLLAPLALAMPAMVPPANLETKIARAVDRAANDLSRTVEERLEEGGWQEVGPQVEIKPLWDDKTFLIRCGPGAVYPGMPGRRFEHGVVLQGDMMVGDQVLEAGDYFRAAAEPAAAAFRSRTGLLLLLRFL